MAYIIPLVLLAVIALAVFFARKKAAYYKKMFSDEHYSEIGNWFVTALKVGATNAANFDDRTTLRTSAECALSFTRTVDAEDEIHIAFSQVRAVTTHAASSRIVFFLLQMLKENKAEANFFYTESGVHHAVFRKNGEGEWLTRPIADALADRRLYEPIPFQFESMKQAEHVTDAPLA